MWLLPSGTRRARCASCMAPPPASP
ncbi:MAG TPA: hypothetical protein DEB46_13480 [Myxococcales bacterium]|nr:hypothetical protein [Myxococcales bacterium]